MDGTLEPDEGVYEEKRGITGFGTARMERHGMEGWMGLWNPKGIYEDTIWRLGLWNPIGVYEQIIRMGRAGMGWWDGMRRLKGGCRGMGAGRM